ncbi:hypothetical protein [Rhizobium sp. GR12]|uniref:hypothetical protein n=1 Tax=Rhizobium sp. GR12 TaxID=3053925 RepID=UPI002FBDBB27
MSEQSSAIPVLPFAPVEVCEGIHSAIAFEVMRDLYGLHAATVAAWCAIEARGDGGDDHYRFWFGLFCELRKASPVFSLLPPPSVKIDRDMSEGDHFPQDENLRDDLDSLLCSQNLRNSIIRRIGLIIAN